MSLNSTDASNFIKSLRHDRVNLVAIHPHTRETIGTTRPNGHEDLDTFIKKYNGEWNLYFSVNEPRAGAPDKKLGKGDIAWIRAVYADLDAAGDNADDIQCARRERDKQVEELGNDALGAPSLLIDSGGGYAAFWVFSQPIPATPETIKDVEAQGRGIAQKLGGDHVQNIDRIMRLPGTINLPDARKRSRGRVAVPARLIHNSGPRHELASLAKFAPPIAASVKAEDPNAVTIDIGIVREADIFTDLPLALRVKVQKLEIDYPHFSAMLAGDFGTVSMIKDRSRSGILFAMVAMLRAAGFTPTEAAQVVWVWPHAYHTEWRADDDAAVTRSFQRAWAACADCISTYEARTKAEDDFAPLEPAKKASRFRLEHFDKIHPDLARRDLIKGLLPRRATLGLIGPANSGKSQVAADMGVHIAAGLPWCGRRVMKGAVVCSLGEGVEGFRGRVQAIRNAKRLSGIPFFIIPAVPNLTSMTDVKDFVETCREAAEISGNDIRIIYIDTLTTAMPGADQNSTEAMSRVVAAARYISNELDCVCAIIHHVGKDRSKGARGSSVLIGNLDTELLVEVTGPKTFSLIQSKQRDFEKGAPIKFEQRFAVIGQDADGEPVTAVFAEYVVSARTMTLGLYGLP